MRKTGRTSVFLRPCRLTAGHRWQASSFCLAMLVFAVLFYGYLSTANRVARLYRRRACIN